MARFSGLGEVAVWRRRLRRFEKAGKTVVGFCEAEDVSTASFYRWRKKLTHRPGTTSDDEHTPTFQAVRVTPDNTPVSIRLPGGARVEVPTDAIDAVRAVLGELLQHEAKLVRGESRC